ncbi:MAG: G8 domain-containing protein, partial [Caldilineaceae bacterium]|nr:G8 domain-containing protein [Caldilineaceae bacterium]
MIRFTKRCYKSRIGLMRLLGRGLLLTLIGLLHYGSVVKQPVFAQSEPGALVITHHESIPNPVFGSALRVAASCKAVSTPCPWERATTWLGNAIPTAESKVIVDGNVQINDEHAIAHSIGIYPGGQLRFNPLAATQLQSGDLVVFAGGRLVVGSEQQPIAPDQRAEIIFRDLPFENDPKQHLRGLVVVDGLLQVHGQPLTETF